jgi:pimeloyl-ACP methyl ester carboxylesterase
MLRLTLGELSMRPARFEVHVAQSELDDLYDRLRRTRYPVDFANEDWSYGTNRTWLESLVGYWLDGYDWRAQEAAINAREHYRIIIDDVPIHFMRVPGRGPKPMPLMLTHGWPETFWDFSAMVDPLSDPGRFGGDPSDSFDLVVPSLPGYVFSSPLTQPGIGVVKTAELWIRLMRDVLGYHTFGTQGGDFGAIVSSIMGHSYPQYLVGVHLSSPTIPGRHGRPGLDDWGADEQGWAERTATRMKLAESHLAVNYNDPQTLAYATNDSPAGLAAWICERRYHFSDTKGDIDSRFSKDHLLTTVMLYWLTQTFGTACRYYAENRRHPFILNDDRSPIIKAPTGFAIFPKELPLLPRRFVERESDLRRWTIMPSGGHYASSEEPDLLVEDVRAFFRALRG